MSRESRVWNLIHEIAPFRETLPCIIAKSDRSYVKDIDSLARRISPRSGRNFAPVNHPARVMRFHFCPAMTRAKSNFTVTRATSGRFVVSALVSPAAVATLIYFPIKIPSRDDSLRGRPPALIDPVVVTALINFIWTLIGLDEFLLPLPQPFSPHSKLSTLLCVFSYVLTLSALR